LYLSGNATGEPWPGTEGLFGVLLEVVFDWDDTLFKEGFGFGLTVILPDKKISVLNLTTGTFQLTNRRRKDS